MTAADEKAGSTLRSSRAVPHPSTNRALRRLTSEFGRDPVHSTWYGRQRGSLKSPGLGIQGEKNCACSPRGDHSTRLNRHPAAAWASPPAEAESCAPPPKGRDSPHASLLRGREPVSTPGVEPGLSRPQRDVLTTRRCGLLRAAHPGRALSQREVGAGVCGGWCCSSRLSDRGCRDALLQAAHMQRCWPKPDATENGGLRGG